MLEDYAGDQMNIDPIEDDKEMSRSITTLIRLRETSELRRSIFSTKKTSAAAAAAGSNVRSTIRENEMRTFLIEPNEWGVLGMDAMDDEDGHNDEEDEDNRMLMITSGDGADDDVVENERFGGAALIKDEIWKNEMRRQRVMLNWKIAWSRIDGGLQLMKHSSIEKCLNFYTDILALHIKHQIRVDPLCLKLLINCVRADLMIEVFEQGLVDVETTNNRFEYLFQTIFASLDYRFYTSRSREPFDIILSLAVLIYKSKSYPFRNKIAQAVQNSLCSFIQRKKYKEGFVKIGMRHFLKCLIINGIYLNNHVMLSKFLTSTSQSRNRPFLAPPRDNDEFIFVGSDEEDEDDDENETDETSALINVNEPDLVTYYPMSLKNLCRIAIKNCMRDYGTKDVQSFTILPNTLKSFLLYQDEIDAILKVANAQI